MAIKTQESINGFVATDPTLTFIDDGRARAYMRIGINHYQRLEDGTFNKLEPTFHDLVQFGKGAERTAGRFVKGDELIAQGRTNEYERTIDGTETTVEQFLAVRVAHDPNTTSYTVQRRTAADREAADAPAERVDPERSDRLGPAEAVGPSADQPDRQFAR